MTRVESDWFDKRFAVELGIFSRDERDRSELDRPDLIRILRLRMIYCTWPPLRASSSSVSVECPLSQFSCVTLGSCCWFLLVEKGLCFSGGLPTLSGIVRFCCGGKLLVSIGMDGSSSFVSAGVVIGKSSPSGSKLTRCTRSWSSVRTLWLVRNVSLWSLSSLLILYSQLMRRSVDLSSRLGGDSRIGFSSTVMRMFEFALSRGTSISFYICCRRWLFATFSILSIVRLLPLSGSFACSRSN